MFLNKIQINENRYNKKKERNQITSKPFLYIPAFGGFPSVDITDHQHFTQQAKLSAPKYASSNPRIGRKKITLYSRHANELEESFFTTAISKQSF